LRALLSAIDIGNGLASRILWIAARRSRYLPFGGSDTDIRPIRERFRQALEFAHNTAREMHLTPGATAEYATHYRRLSTPPPGVLGEVTSRATSHLVRLAMIFALLDRSSDVREEHIRAALELVDASGRAAAHIFGSELGNPMAEKILDALRTAPHGMSRTEISTSVFQRNKKSSEIVAALAFLVRH
jgi:hypothetical protein